MKQFCFLLALGVFSAPTVYAEGTMAANAVRLSTAPKSIVLLPETATFKPGPNSDLAQTVCSDCHSVDFATTQPVLTRAQWAKEIDKMKAAFGAGPTWVDRGVSDADIQLILDYLVQYYGKEQ